MKKAMISIIFILAMLTLGCTAAQQPQEDAEQMTVGTVQRKIEIGMSGADVIAALGSPNMVTTDDKRRETWIYDKISSEVSQTSSGAGFSLIIVGAGKSSSSTKTSQKTMTVIIKFDEEKKVRDFAYHSSQF